MVFADPAVTDVACAGLNGMRMGERVLTVRRATEVRSSCCMLCLVCKASRQTIAIIGLACNSQLSREDSTTQANALDL